MRVYRDNRPPRFQRVKAPDKSELEELFQLISRRVGRCPQTALSFQADFIRETLGIDSSNKLLFGISFGYPDPDAAANSYVTDRASVADTVTFHD